MTKKQPTRVIMFKPWIAPKVLDGSKPHTIRKRAKCKPGDRLSLRRWEGKPRQSGSHHVVLREETCVAVYPITIGDDDGSPGRIVLDGVDLSALYRRNRLARKDGFGSWSDFFAFFKEVYGLPFEGELIAWLAIPELEVWRRFPEACCKILTSDLIDPPWLRKVVVILDKPDGMEIGRGRVDSEDDGDAWESAARYVRAMDAGEDPDEEPEIPGEDLDDILIAVPANTDISILEKEYPDIFLDDSNDETDSYWLEDIGRDEAIEACAFAEGVINGADTLIEGNGPWAQGQLRKTDQWKRAYEKGVAARTVRALAEADHIGGGGE